MQNNSIVRELHAEVLTAPLAITRFRYTNNPVGHMDTLFFGIYMESTSLTRRSVK